MNKMTGYSTKGRRKISEQEKDKAANAPSSSGEDDKISKLKDLNEILVKEITGLREEKAILSTNLTEMAIEIESTRKMSEEWKEAQKELREELGKKDGEYQANLLSKLAKLQTNLDLMASEKESLSETKREQRTEADSSKAQLVSEIESTRETTEDLKQSEKELTKELGKKDRKYQAAISQAGKRLQETEERFNTEISAKERECRAANLDKTKLEATVLQLKNQIQVISAELEATSKHAKLGRNFFLSEIAAAKKEIAEITRCNQMAQEAWNAEKEKLLSRLSELQTNLELVTSDKGSLIETNRELRTEAESWKAQLNYYIDILVRMEHEKQVLETVSVSNAEMLEALLQQNATMEKEIFILQQRVDENVKQHAYEIQQYKVAENCVKKQNEMLDREIEIRNKTIHERVVESVKQYTNEIQHCKVAENSVKEQNQMLDRKGEASSQQKD